MEIIIDIPEEVRVNITRVGLLRVSDEDKQIVSMAINSAKPLPQTQYWVHKQGKGWFCPECDTVGDTHFNYCPYCATPLKLKESE